MKSDGSQMQLQIKKGIFGLIFLLMGVQIVLGAAWMLGNLRAVQEFAESRELVEISKTWVLDEYVGIAYPGCIWLVRGLQRLTGIPKESVLYICQLAAAFFAGVYFLKNSGVTDRLRQAVGKWTVYYGAAYLLTVPMLMQCHMAVLPFSFAYSVMLILLTDCIQLMRKAETVTWRRFLRICAMWFLGASLLPEYGWLGAIPVLTAFAGSLLRKSSAEEKENGSRKRGRTALTLAAAFMVTVFAITGTAAVTQTPGSRGRMQKTFQAAMLSRFVWPNFARNSYFWQDDITNVCGADELWRISQIPEKIVYEFGFPMEQTHGKEKANVIYGQMARTSFRMRTRETVEEIAGDGLSYLCPQIAVQRNLAGKGVSFTGWNYSRMQQHTPALTKYYVGLSLKIWNILAVLTVLQGIAYAYGFLTGKRGQKKNTGGLTWAWLYGVTTAAFAVWYTMSAAGMQDYRNVPVIWALWAVSAIKGWDMLCEGAERKRGNEQC